MRSPSPPTAHPLGTTAEFREVVDDFVNRLFDGRALPLVQHLIEDQGLTDAEIDQLQATLGKLKEKKT